MQGPDEAQSLLSKAKTSASAAPNSQFFKIDAMHRGKIIKLSDSVNSYEYLLRIAIIGDDNSGKTNIIRRMKGEQFNNEHVPTTNTDFQVLGYEIGGKKIKLQLFEYPKSILDNSGGIRMPAGFHAVILVCDSTKLQYSMDDFSFYQSKFRWLSLQDNAPKIIAVTKCGFNSPASEIVSSIETNGRAQGFSGLVKVNAQTGMNIQTLLDQVCVHTLKNLGVELNEQALAQEQESQSFFNCCKIC